MADRGWRKFDEIVGEDGTRCLIRVNSETGVFRATVAAGKENDFHTRPVFQEEDKDLETLKKKAAEFLRDSLRLDFRPFIIIREPGELNSWEQSRGRVESDERIALVYERYFVAKRKDGTTIWKDFRAKGGTGKDEVSGEPGPTVDRQHYVYSAMIEYTAARWSALRLISRAIQSLNERLRTELLGEDVGGFLESVVQKGAAGLLAGSGPKMAKEM